MEVKTDNLPESPVTQDDYFTLIGHAEYLRSVHGQTDMPNYFFGLAARLGQMLGDPELTRRANEMRKGAE